MVGSAYTTKELSRSNNPLTTPETIETAIKLQYHENVIGRNLLGFQGLVTSTTSTIEEGDTEGDIDWLSENGSLPKMDFTFLKGTKRVRPYGGYFEVSEEQQEDNLTDEIKVMVNNVAYAMAYFEDLMVFNDVIHATGINSVDARKPWDVSTGSTAGDPAFDVGKAKRAIKIATKKTQRADSIAMSSLTLEYLSGFDYIKSRLYNTQSADGYIVTGVVQTFMGLTVIEADAIDPDDEGRALVFKNKDMGVWQERYPIRTKSITGDSYGKDNVAFKYTAKAKGEPNIKFAKLGCVLNGLYTT